MLQDTYRGPGLTCSVMLSLERRKLVEKRTVVGGYSGHGWLWYLTEAGEQAARVCKMKHDMSQKPDARLAARLAWPKGTP